MEWDLLFKNVIVVKKGKSMKQKKYIPKVVHRWCRETNGFCYYAQTCNACDREKSCAEKRGTHSNCFLCKEKNIDPQRCVEGMKGANHG